MQNKNHQINQHDKGLCRICGTKLENGVCAICGWTQIIFPSEIPTEIIEFNKQREKVAQNLHKEVCELKDTLKKLEKKVVLLTDEKTKLGEEQKVLEQQLRAENGKVLKMEADLRKALEDVNKSNLSDLKGIVIISDMTFVNPSDISAYASTPINRQCLPVLSGVNTYGSAMSEGNHYQITIKRRGDVFLSKHFAVDTSHSRGLVIKDLSNGRITLNGNHFNEEYVGNSKFFIKQGRQIFSIEIKSLIF